MICLGFAGNLKGVGFCEARRPVHHHRGLASHALPNRQSWVIDLQVLQGFDLTVDGKEMGYQMLQNVSLRLPTAYFPGHSPKWTG